jgi:hypothetical protein
MLIANRLFENVSQFKYLGTTETNHNLRRMMYIGYWWESRKERGHKENEDVGGGVILHGILER